MEFLKWCLQNWYLVALIILVLVLVLRNPTVSAMADAIMQAPVRGTLSVILHYIVRAVVVVLVTLILTAIVYLLVKFFNTYGKEVFSNWLPKLQTSVSDDPAWKYLPTAIPSTPTPVP